MNEGSMLSDLKIVTEQLQFPEGPVVLSNGDVLVVEIKRGTLSRVTPDGEVFVEAYVGGGPNGAALGPHGDVFICNNGGFEWQEVDGITIPLHTPDSYEGGSIQRVNRATGEVNVLYTHCGDRPLYGLMISFLILLAVFTSVITVKRTQSTEPMAICIMRERTDPRLLVLLRGC